MRRKLPYCPRHGGTPEQNLAAFIALARASGNLGRALDFDAHTWDVTDVVFRRKGVPPRGGRQRLLFTSTGSRGSRKIEPMQAAFGAFMRAFVRQLPPTGFQAMRDFIYAGSHIAKAMSRLGVSTVSGCNVAILDEVMCVAGTRYTRDVAQRIGYNVQRIAQFLDLNGMVHAPIAGWQHPYRVKDTLPSRPSAEFEERSAKLLPSAEFLDFLTRAYHLATDPTDIIVSRVTVLLSAAPERINEALALDEHPEVERVAGDKHVLGLRWRGSKCYSDSVKLVPSVMAPVIRDALASLRQVTEEGRRIKRWYDSNKAEIYLPEQLEHLRGKSRLSVSELGALLGLPANQGLHRYVRECRIARLPPVDGRFAAAHNVSFASFQSHILSRLAAHMHAAGGEATHPLLVVPWKTFQRLGRTPCPCMFEIVGYHHIARGLKPRLNQKSMFQRLGLDPGGSVAVKTHSLRHWTYTQAKRGGLSESDLAVWVGHADAHHNRFYDHRSAAEMRDLAGKANARSRRTTSPLARPKKLPEPDGTGAPA